MCLANKKRMDVTDFVVKAIDTFNNYETVKKSLKNNEKATQSFKRQVHFDYAIFLQNLLSAIRGKFEVK